jgi:hypothetical protein
MENLPCEIIMWLLVVWAVFLFILMGIMITRTLWRECRFFIK